MNKKEHQSATEMFLIDALERAAKIRKIVVCRFLIPAYMHKHGTWGSSEQQSNFHTLRTCLNVIVTLYFCAMPWIAGDVLSGTTRVFVGTSNIRTIGSSSWKTKEKKLCYIAELLLEAQAQK